MKKTKGAVAVVTIRVLKKSDAFECSELDGEAFSAENAWTEEIFREHLRRTNTNTRYYGAFDRKLLVGYIGITLYDDQNNDGVIDEAYIENLAVRMAYQRQGIGTALMKYVLDMIDEAVPVVLHVETDNIAAIELYKRHGFAIRSRTVGYYNTKKDAFTMVK